MIGVVCNHRQAAASLNLAPGLSNAESCCSAHCQLQAQFGGIFGAPCTLQPVAVPAQQPQWSCGLTLYGYFTCSRKHGPSQAGARLQPFACLAPQQHSGRMKG